MAPAVGEFGYAVKSMYDLDLGDVFVEYRIRGSTELKRSIAARDQPFAGSSRRATGSLTDRPRHTDATARESEIADRASHRRRLARTEGAARPLFGRQLSQTAWLGQQEEKRERQRRLHRDLGVARTRDPLNASLSPSSRTKRLPAPHGSTPDAGFGRGENSMSMTMRLVAVEAENRNLKQELARIREVMQRDPASRGADGALRSLTSASEASADAGSSAVQALECQDIKAEASVDTKRAERTEKRRQAELRRQQREEEQRTLVANTASLSAETTGESARISDTRTSNVLREYHVRERAGERGVVLPEPAGHRLLAPISSDAFDIFDKVHQGCQTEMHELDKAAVSEAGFKEQRLTEMLQVRLPMLAGTCVSLCLAAYGRNGGMDWCALLRGCLTTGRSFVVGQSINMVMAKASTNEHVLSRREAEVPSSLLSCFSFYSFVFVVSCLFQQARAARAHAQRGGCPRRRLSASECHPSALRVVVVVGFYDIHPQVPHECHPSAWRVPCEWLTTGNEEEDEKERAFQQRLTMKPRHR